MNLKRTIQIAVSVILLGVLIQWIDLGQVKSALASADLFYLILALIVTTLNRILMPIKWNLLLRAKNIRVSWYEVTKIYYTSTFFGVFLPPTIGSDSVRAYLTAKKGPNFTDVISSILVERVLGMILLFLFGIVGGAILLSWFADLEFDIKILFWACIVLTILGIGGFVLSLSRRFAGMVFRFLDRLRRIRNLEKLTAMIEKLYRSYQLYREHKGTLFIFFLLTSLENLLAIIRSYIIAISFSATVPFAYFFAIVPIELILIRLPLSFDGFGIREGIFVFFLSLIGISTEVGFSVGLTNHLVFLIALLPGGVIYLFNRERSEILLTVPGSPGRSG